MSPTTRLCSEKKYVFACDGAFSWDREILPLGVSSTEWRGAGNAVARIPPGVRVLVVEDEFMIAMAVEAVVIDAGGIVVEMAATLEQAMGLSTTAEFDAALLDINLNGENTFPVADILVKRGIPFAFVTGYGRKMVPDAFATAPILTKPYARTDLMRVLGSLCENAIR